MRGRTGALFERDFEDAAMDEQSGRREKVERDLLAKKAPVGG